MPVRPRILVTGAEGFVARHLLPLLSQTGAEVFGTVFQTPSTPLPIRTFPLDLREEEHVRTLLHDVRPTQVVHLAAISSVRDSFTDPAATVRVNVEGTRALLEAAGSLASVPRVLLIGSSDEYGPNDGQPLSELPVSALRPVSPYGESKRDVERLVENSPALRAMTIRTRSFPHIGPGQAGRFFIPEVAQQLVRIERGEQPPVIGIGNLEAVRDFTDVHDVVRSYVLLLERGEAGEVYNVCSGAGRRIHDLLDLLVRLSGVTVRIEQDPAKLRPVDIPVLVGNPAKLQKATGWMPQIPLEQTLRDVLVELRASSREQEKPPWADGGEEKKHMAA